MQTLLQNWKIYLDTCCLNRLFNDQTQTRIHQETETVKIILARFFTTQWQWLISTALVNTVGIAEIERGTQLESLRFKWLDALHIACAESGRADILLTTDDRMLRRAKRFRLQLRVRVENPYTWLEEISKHEHTKAAGR